MSDLHFRRITWAAEEGKKMEKKEDKKSLAAEKPARDLLLKFRRKPELIKRKRKSCRKTKALKKFEK